MNITKKLSAVIFCAMMFVMGAILSACDQPTIQNLTISTNSITTEYMLDDTIDLSDIKVLVRFSDETIKEIGFDDIEITQIDTTTPGIKTLTVTYQGKSTTISIYVYQDEDESIKIFQYQKPAFVTTYENNIKQKSHDTRLEFTNREDGYFVGDDNPFKFLPIMNTLDGDDMITINRYTSKSTIEIWESNDWRTLATDTEIASMVAINERNSTYDFTELAIGEKFRLTVRPAFQPEKTPISFEFRVIDGWNAYTAADLSKLDNNSQYEIIVEGDSQMINPWAEYKAANGISQDNISGLIMHSDILITSNDIPKYYMYSKDDQKTDATIPNSWLGSLKDWTSIYALHTAVDTQFNFIGNYFQIDASQIPLIKYVQEADAVIEGGKGYHIHSTLFGFGGDDDNIANEEMNGKIKVKNINFVGNAERSENYLLSGGIVFFRATSQEFVLENTLARKVLTLAVPFGEWDEETEVLKNNNIIKDSKGYDSFSAMFILWGASMDFVNCEYKDAGGPIMILSHYENGDSDYPQKYGYSTVEADNCEFESLVSGQEAWFQISGASDAAASIALLLQSLSDYAAHPPFNTEYNLAKQVDDHTTIFNIVSIILTGDFDNIFAAPPVSVRGRVALNVGEDDQILDMDATIYRYRFDSCQFEPLFVSPDGGACYLAHDGEGNPTGFASVDEHTITKENFFSNDKMYLYNGAMGVLLEVVPASA